MKVLAHRGGALGARENTAAAFQAAVAAGADGFETDVRRTRDGALVLYHDRNLPSGRALASQSLADIRHEHPELQLLRMQDALQRWPASDWNLEAKTADVLPSLYDLLRGLNLAGDVLVSSFDHAALEHTSAPPGVHLGALVAHHPFATCPVPLGHWPRMAGLDTIVWCFDTVDLRDVEKARARGLRSLVWGAETLAEHAELVRWPLHALITDHPELARRALAGVRASPP